MAPNGESTSFSDIYDNDESPTKTKYYLSYIVVSDIPPGHAVIGITEHNTETGEQPKMIASIGFYGSNQVKLEKPEVLLGKNLSHKTYEISRKEMEALFIKINQDRRINQDRIMSQDISKYSNFQRYTEPVQNSSNNPSLPGGPEYSLLKFNCKTYALSLLKQCGIIDKSLRNTGPDVPVLSGNLTKFELMSKLPSKLKSYDTSDDTSGILIWKEPPVITERPGVQSSISKKILDPIIFTINKYINKNKMTDTDNPHKKMARK